MISKYRMLANGPHKVVSMVTHPALVHPFSKLLIAIETVISCLEGRGLERGRGEREKEREREGKGEREGENFK